MQRGARFFKKTSLPCSAALVLGFPTWAPSTLGRTRRDLPESVPMQRGAHFFEKNAFPCSVPLKVLGASSESASPKKPEKTLKSVYFKWFGAFLGDPFWATIFGPERSHAAWRSFFWAPERSHAAWRSFLDRDFFFLLIWWSYVGPMRASKISIKPMYFCFF